MSYPSRSAGLGTRRIVQTASLIPFLIAALVAGCGTPAAPLSPSLKLPEPPKDLSVKRSNRMVYLQWTMPRRSTDNRLLEGKVGVYVWRTPGSGKGELVGDLSIAPGTAGAFADQLPPQLQTGLANPIFYSVELMNHLGHSAGLSNVACSAAGVAPPPLEDLSAEMTKAGVYLRWTKETSAQAPDVLRIHRKLLDSAPAKKLSQEAAGPEPRTLTLLVNPGNGPGRGGALDPSALFGRHYEYWVERAERVSLRGQSIEILSEPSNSVVVDTRDVFPPAPPQQLAAVAVPAQRAIDLSWSPNTEADLAGYVVYRSQDGGRPERVSPKDTFLIAPSFRDATPLAAHQYRYSVSAVDVDGNESPRSAEAAESLPQ